MLGFPQWHLGVLLLIAIANLALFWDASSAPNGPLDPATSPTERHIAAPVFDRAPRSLPTSVGFAPRWRQSLVRRGDTLSAIFARADIDNADLVAISELENAGKELKSIRPGQSLFLLTDTEGDLLALQFPKSRLETLVIERAQEGFSVDRITEVPERRVATRAAEIKSSLFVAGRKVGLDDKLTMSLAQVFQWDIDFALDIRKGDSFAVIYEELVIDGEVIGHGDILAAQFVNQGQHYEAVRYTTLAGDTDFFMPNGRAMKKAFLRAPLEFSRVSSNFNMRRFHPIRRVVRPHRGTDYAAPTGTPIWAAGNGRVAKIGRNSASGNFIYIKHGDNYETRYLHLSRFASNLKAGAKVEQGDVIGYVGATGWATGPHLHYEFLVDGVHQNPRTISLLADPISKKELPRFQAHTSQWIASLNNARNSQLALANGSTEGR